MQDRVAVIGDADFVMPFLALGLDTYTVGETAESAIEQAESILKGQYALIAVAENIAPNVEQVFAAKQDEPTPSIVVVPFTTASTGFATKTLGSVLKMATGINILQNS